MKIQQELWNNNDGWAITYQKGAFVQADLVFVFGGKSQLSKKEVFQDICQKYPKAEIILCSTSGEIMVSDVYDNSLALTAIQMEHTAFQTLNINIEDVEDSYHAGQTIVSQLKKTELNHIFLIADGQLVNGSEFVRGINEQLENNVMATGGLAGDGVNFQETLVGLNRTPGKGNIVAVGFYGDRLKVGFGSKGGWDTFGPKRNVSRSKGNVLYELDGQSALSLYKTYLGESAEQLPSSALFFPLAIHMEDQKDPLVRTILSVSETDKSMTFAGDIPEGATVSLMRHNFDKLIDGAEAAAEHCINTNQDFNPDLAILVSCVGRKVVMGQHIDEEIEVVRNLFGKEAAITGFYSYGEIAPFTYLSNCALHNQTMTITTFTEI